MRCRLCGNENGEANRFCGMCGAALVASERAGGQTPVPGQTAARGAGGVAAEERSAAGDVSMSDAGSSPDRSDAWPSTRPVISGGPSLLGLNVASPDAGRGGPDAIRPSSSSVEYLLEDEEEPRRSWGKLILVVAALVLAVGFGYLHWKSGGFDWVSGGDKKPAAAAVQTPDSGQSGADSGGATAAPAGGAVNGSAGSAGESSAPQATAPEIASQGTPSQNAAAPAGPAQAVAPESADQQNAARESSVPAGGSQAAGSDSDQQSPAAEAAPRVGARKPATARAALAKPVAAKPVDSVVEGERYIYGRGVGQDCDRGLRLLKPAAGQSNVRAMISLGALYSTGVCTPRDLPTAYRWFALALHKEPDNQALQNDLQGLWSKMTQPERQLAIKLSR